MTPTHVELSSAMVLARPPTSVAPPVTPAVFRGELSRGFTPGEHADARSMLVLAQYRPGAAMRPIPVPPSRGGYVGGGYTGGYVAPSYGYATPGYGYSPQGYGYAPQTGLSLGLTFGNGQTSLWAGTGTPLAGQQYGYGYGQVAPYEMLVTNGSSNRWVRAGQQVPPGWVQTVPSWWDNIFTPYLY